ncbi:hypothetical protein ACL2XQ_06830 [Sodalis sp. RH14]|uniref:hypothetical protein n=1 Tax=Sodalis sp. RH14 TaxID=3394329 RepID=UPI0039B4AC75
MLSGYRQKLALPTGWGKKRCDGAREFTGKGQMDGIGGKKQKKSGAATPLLYLDLQL